jgi:hypothetical protein
MIRYALVCDHDHEFEGWFGASGDFDDQQARGLVECPVCASRAVRKQIMAPAVVGAKKRDGGDNPPLQTVIKETMRKLRQHVVSTFDNVGDGFADEARAIHEGRSEQRGIYGQASTQEVRDLVEDGVPIAPMPDEPPKKTDLN